MISPSKRTLYALTSLTALLLLQACATPLPPARPVAVEKIKLDALPASVTQIDSRLSDSWQEKESAYLKKVEDFSSSAPSK